MASTWGRTATYIVADALASVLDLLLTGEEEQNVTRRLAQMQLHHGVDRRLEIVSLGLGCVKDLDRMQTTRNSLCATHGRRWLVSLRKTKQGGSLETTLATTTRERTKRGAPSKYDWNFSASRVALMTTSLRSLRDSSTCFMSPKRISVARVRSCASSRMITLHASTSQCFDHEKL